MIGIGEKLRCYRTRDGVSLTTLALLALCPGLANAQTTEPKAEVPAAIAAADQTAETPAEQSGSKAPAGEAADTEIVVTGSRVARNGFTAPTPTTVLGTNELEKRAVNNVADLLNAIPSFGQSTTPGSTNHTSQNSGANLVNLRGLGAVRTLVLVDGKRFVPSTVNGRIDLNVIPTVLIERTEIVTGGASAAWGSDAVAGVVNLIFKKRIEGLQGDVQTGISTYGDNRSTKASLGWGTEFADGRGRFSVAGEYEDSEGVGPFSNRHILLQNRQLIANPNYVAGTGQPQRYVAQNVNVSTATLGGLITGIVRGGVVSTSGPLVNTQFLPGGATAPFVRGTLASTSYMVGGSPIGGFSQNELGTIQVPLERQIAYAKAAYDILDDVTAGMEGSYSRTFNQFDLSIPYDLGTIPIARDNAFLPTDVRNTMIANGITALRLGRINLDTGYNRPRAENETYRFLATLQGKVDRFNWSAYYQAGRNRYQQDVEGNRITANFSQAVDAVVNPATSQIVCRTTLTNPSNGCVPINLFGYGSPSAAAAAYISGTSSLDARYYEQSAAFDINGDLFTNWAGPVSVALGTEWRKDKLRQTVDPLSAAGGFNIHNPRPIRGELSVREVYGETVFPLLSDVTLAKSLEFNAAIRYTDYSSSGGVTTWKLGGTWQPVSDLRFRVTRSRDIRAAALGELYASYILQQANIIDPTLNNIQYVVNTPTRGNTALEPEKADTWTAGVVLTPGFLPRFSVSADFYDIKLDGVIATPVAQDIVDRCARNADPVYCALVTRSSNGRVTEVARAYVNQSRLRTRGVDFELGYSQPLAEVANGLDGTLSLRALATYVDKLTSTDNGVAIEGAGVVGTSQNGIPHWRWNTTATYDNGPVTAFVEGRYVGGGLYNGQRDSSGTLITQFLDGDNHIDGQFLLNMSLQYTVKGLGGEVSLFTSVRNVLNDIANRNPHPYILSTSSNAALYDILGRQVTVGARFRF